MRTQSKLLSLALALLLLVITPVTAADMYCDMNTNEVINDV